VNPSGRVIFTGVGFEMFVYDIRHWVEGIGYYLSSVFCIK